MNASLTIVPWREVGVWALVLDGKLVTCGRRQYIEQVVSTAPLKSLQAARDGVCWEFDGARAPAGER
jgi:hypothetical protein